LAFQDNLVGLQGVDSLLTDVPGRSRSPYLKKTALVVSPLSETTHSASVAFITGGAFTLQAATATIASIEADFGDGLGWRLLPASGTLNVTFPAAGVYALQFKLTRSDGAVRYSYANLKVASAPPALSKTELQQKALAVNSCTSSTIVSSRTFQGYTEAQPYSGAGEYEVFLGGGSFDKPVIVLEGFDPLEGDGDDGNDLDDIYDDFLEYNNKADNLGDDLRFTHDFDIVVLNFINYRHEGELLSFVDDKTINGGSDYIERNAMVLIDLIEQVNSCKIGANPIKIIGFSMGGLVARYALRYMELNGIPHNADLFVSVDTPHKGAVVPIGVQELAHLVDDIVPFGLGNAADDVLHTPAAKQMLLHHFLANSQTPQGAPGFHETFYSALDAMGFPQQTRNIAVVNGTANGIPINTPGQQYINAEAGASVLAVGAKAKIKLKYAPEEGLTRQAMNVKIKLQLLLADITVYQRVRDVTTPATTGSYENTPGGFIDVTNLVEQFLSDYIASSSSYSKLQHIGSLFTYSNLTLDNPNFSLVPVKSALAFTGANAGLYEDFSSRNLVCSGETLFDSYYTPPVNQPHTALTADSVNFITQELLGVPQDPNINIAGEELISGPSVVCAINTVFTLPSCSANGVTWSVSPNLQIVGTTPTSITVKAIDASTRGAGSIATIFNGQAALKLVYVGKPKTPAGGITGPTSVAGGFLVNYFGVPAEGATAYQWKVPYPYTVGGALNSAAPDWNIRSTAGYSAVTAFTGTQANAGFIQLMGENDCGCGGAITLQVNAAGGGPKPGGVGTAPQGGIPKMTPIPTQNVAVSSLAEGAETSEQQDERTDALKDIVVYPNPSAAEARLSLNGFLWRRDAVMRVIQLFDAAGNLVRTLMPNAREATLAIADLSGGLYTLAVDVNGEVFVKKLVVNR
jgi:Secretion system C-terminal sorting domain/PGAP1-like protein/PKD-like domain